MAMLLTSYLLASLYYTTGMAQFRVILCSVLASAVTKLGYLGGGMNMHWGETLHGSLCNFDDNLFSSNCC